MTNRSVPVQGVLPHIAYAKLPEAISWLTEVFGFSEYYRYGEPVSGAQLILEEACIQLRSAGTQATPAELGYGTQFLTVFVNDVDAHFATTKSAGAEIWETLHETVYGERQYGAQDLEGHRWLFSQHARDVDPADWGATVR